MEIDSSKHVKILPFKKKKKTRENLFNILNSINRLIKGVLLWFKKWTFIFTVFFFLKKSFY